MRTDRELLELAAKAAGLKVDWRNSVNCLCYSESPYNVAWSPLTDDGDALRLAVALRLTIDIERVRPCVVVGDHTGRYGSQAWTSAGPLEATRRAIVRAAAKIGAGMP